MRLLDRLFSRLGLSDSKQKSILWSRVQLERPVYFERHVGAEFLILAGGPSVLSKSDEIQNFIAKNKPIVIGCNRIPDLYLPDYHVFVNRRRFRAYGALLAPGTKPLLSPTFPSRLIREVIGDRVFETVMFYSVHPGEKGRFSLENGIIYAEGATVAMVAMGVALSMGAKSVYVAGLDGYSMHGGDQLWYGETRTKAFDYIMRREQMIREVLADFSRIAKSRGVRFEIITPTTYSEYNLSGVDVTSV